MVFGFGFDIDYTGAMVTVVTVNKVLDTGNTWSGMDELIKDGTGVFSMRH